MNILTILNAFHIKQDHLIDVPYLWLFSRNHRFSLSILTRFEMNSPIPYLISYSKSQIFNSITTLHGIIMIFFYHAYTYRRHWQQRDSRVISPFRLHSPTSQYNIFWVSVVAVILSSIQSTRRSLSAQDGQSTHRFQTRSTTPRWQWLTLSLLFMLSDSVQRVPRWISLSQSQSSAWQHDRQYISSSEAYWSHLCCFSPPYLCLQEESLYFF